MSLGCRSVGFESSAELLLSILLLLKMQRKPNSQMWVKIERLCVKTFTVFMDTKMSVNVKYSRIPNNKDRHVNHYDVTGTH